MHVPCEIPIAIIRAHVKTESISSCVCPRGRKTAGNAGPSSTKTGGAPASVSDSSDTQSKFNAGGGLSPAGSAPCVCVVSWAVVEWKKATRRSSIVKRTGWWARLLRSLVLLHKLLLLHLCVLCMVVIAKIMIVTYRDRDSPRFCPPRSALDAARCLSTPLV